MMMDSELLDFQTPPGTLQQFLYCWDQINQ